MWPTVPPVSIGSDSADRIGNCLQASRSMSASGGRSAILETRIGARSTSSLRYDQGKTGARFMSAGTCGSPSA